MRVLKTRSVIIKANRTGGPAVICQTLVPGRVFLAVGGERRSMGATKALGGASGGNDGSTCLPFRISRTD